MPRELTVYLDRHIPRDNLLYKSSNETISPLAPQELPPKLRVRDLFGEDAVDDLLRKPDFQRATSAWTPRECVSLLESVLIERVIPSIIMWRSPEKRWYVLDGGHRISVVLAWLRDDWGDTLSSDEYMDKELEERYKQAAKEVRKLLVEKGIRKFEEYRQAYRSYTRNYGDSQEIPFGVDAGTAKLIEVYRGIKGTMGFPLQWVEGDYDKAEESFLNINKSGRKLTDWEKRLVENRNSSLARVVISVANISDVAYCWPSKRLSSNSPTLSRDISSIHERSAQLHRMLFEPSYDPSFQRIQQPLLVESRTEPDTKAAYLAELITVIRGYKGKDAQTEKLLKLDQAATETELVSNGLRLLQESVDVCSHLIGSSAQPQSLSIVPALYFYTDGGKHIRSLLYGFIYWLFSGSDEQILSRKLLFSVHRATFENFLLEKKKSIVGLFSRKIGSGSEVTGQMAKYYNKLLELLIKYNDDSKAEGFVKEYEVSITKKEDTNRSAGGKSRTFSDRQKAAISIRAWLDRLPTCDICGGMLDLAVGKQYDHVTEHSKGGATIVENGRATHPFCNNNRRTIERIKNGLQKIELPLSFDSSAPEKPIQLSFLTDLDYDDYDSPLSGMSD